MTHNSFDRKAGASWATAIGIVFIAPALVWAQAPMPQTTTSTSPSFAIRSFDISGEVPLSDGEVSRVLAPFLRA